MFKAPTRAAFISAVIFTVLNATQAAAASCAFPAPGRVAVSLDRENGRVAYDNGISGAELDRLRRHTGRSSALGGGSWLPVGLTTTELAFQMRVSVETIRMGSGSHCARLAGVDASLGYNLIRVYIDRRYRPGSCAYKSIVDHEQLHVGVFRRTLDAYHPAVRRGLEQMARSLTPVLARSAEQAAKRLEDRLRRAVSPVFDAMHQRLSKDNNRLDTPERYRMEQARCTDW